MQIEWRALVSYNSQTEAQIVKGKLESFGIHVHLSKDDCGGMEPQLQLNQGVYLLVNPEQWEQAKSILDGEGEKE